MIDTLGVKVEHLRQRAIAGFTTVTELADTLVRESGLPFRQAHSLVAALVRHAGALGLAPADLSADILREVAADTLGRQVELSDEAFARALDPRAFVDARVLPGGAAPSATAAVLAAQETAIGEDRDWLANTQAALAAADAMLHDEVAALTS